MVNKKKIVVCQDRDGKEHKTRVDKLELRVGVYGVLIEHDKVLLSKQWDGYDFPGGGLKIGETIDETLEREFFEETGLKIKRGEILAGESSFFKTSFTTRYLNNVLVYYLCKRVGGELSLDNIDEQERSYMGMPEWIAFGDIFKIKFYNGVLSIKIIEKAREILNG